MKKITIVSLASLVFLLLCSLVEQIISPFMSNQILALVLGIGVLIASGILALCVRESRVVNIICFLLSSAAMGFLIRAWYVNRGFNNSFSLMALISLAAVLYLWCFFALSKIPFIHKSKAAYAILCIAYAILSLVLYLIVMLNTKTTYVSTFGYYMIIELAFIFAMSLEVNNTDELIRNLTLSTYSVLIVAIIAAVVILIAAAGGDGCDCDCAPDGCCECFDGCGDCNLGGDSKGAKKEKEK
jgi:hypothetical protein